MRQILRTRLSQRRGRFGLSLALALAALAALVSTAAHATFPGENGRIAFGQLRSATDYNRQAIVTINPDGTGARDLTHPRVGIQDQRPDWSPNGRWITYMHFRKGGTGHIYRIRANGTDRKNLSKGTCTQRGWIGSCIQEAGSSWSPSGRRIAFSRIVRHRHGNLQYLMVMRANGTHRRRVTHPPPKVEDAPPQFSPDGNRLAFERCDKRDRARCAIFTVRLNGTHTRRLTPWKLNAWNNPDWSPNGRWLVFSDRHRVNCCTWDNLWVVHPNGSGLTQITANPGHQLTWGPASFSPDGTMIATGGVPGVGLGEAQDIFLMNADGGGLLNLTRSFRWEADPDWGPVPRG